MRLLILVVLASLIGRPACAQPQPNAENFGPDMQSYFRHPDPAAIVDEFLRLPPSELSRPDRVFVLGAFFAQLIDAQPSVGDLLARRSAGADANVKRVVVAALNFSRHPQREDLVRKLAGDQAVRPAPPGFSLLRVPLTNPVYLDMLWAAFFATGDTRYVDRIAQATAGDVSNDELRRLEAQARIDQHPSAQLVNALIAKAAVWSLTSNAQHYREVHDALARFAGEYNGTAAQTVRSILAGNSPR